MKKLAITVVALLAFSSSSAFAADTAAKEQELIAKVLSDLDASNAKLKASKKSLSRDCIEDCSKSYDSCMKNAGSPLEKAVCKSDYNLCISNC